MVPVSLDFPLICHQPVYYITAVQLLYFGLYKGVDVRILNY